MTPSQAKQWEQSLRALGGELVRQGPHRTEGTATAQGEGKPDEDAQPLAEMLQAIASKRNANQAQLLARIQKTLAKVGTGDAGVCEECGDDIAWGRLKAMPFSEFCVACQAQKDGPKGMPTRKKLTDFK